MVEEAVPSPLMLPGGRRVAIVARVPVLGAPKVERPMLLALNLTDFDGQPPTAELLLPDRTPLPAGEWPGSLDGQGIVNGHRDYNRPWFCRRGLREYHTHPQHEDNPWDAHREGLPLHSLIEELLGELAGRFVAR